MAKGSYSTKHMMASKPMPMKAMPKKMKQMRQGQKISGR